jgi:hypothetical protein
LRRNQSRRKDSGRNADYKSGKYQQKAFAQHQPGDGFPLCAQRHANSNFICSASYALGHQTVQAD